MALFLVFIITNILWALYSVYLHESWKDAYEDMNDEWIDYCEGLAESLNLMAEDCEVENND